MEFTIEQRDYRQNEYIVKNRSELEHYNRALILQMHDEGLISESERGLCLVFLTKLPIELKVDTVRGHLERVKALYPKYGLWFTNDWEEHHNAPY